MFDAAAALSRCFYFYVFFSFFLPLFVFVVTKYLQNRIHMILVLIAYANSKVSGATAVPSEPSHTIEVALLDDWACALKDCLYGGQKVPFSRVTAHINYLNSIDPDKVSISVSFIKVQTFRLICIRVLKYLFIYLFIYLLIYLSR